MPSPESAAGGDKAACWTVYWANLLVAIGQVEATSDEVILVRTDFSPLSDHHTTLLFVATSRRCPTSIRLPLTAVPRRPGFYCR